jgi:hypothetical protein
MHVAVMHSCGTHLQQHPCPTLPLFLRALYATRLLSSPMNPP